MNHVLGRIWTSVRFVSINTINQLSDRQSMLTGFLDFNKNISLASSQPELYFESGKRMAAAPTHLNLFPHHSNALPLLICRSAPEHARR